MQLQKCFQLKRRGPLSLIQHLKVVLLTRTSNHPYPQCLRLPSMSLPSPKGKLAPTIFSSFLILITCLRLAATKGFSTPKVGLCVYRSTSEISTPEVQEPVTANVTPLSQMTSPPQSQAVQRLQSLIAASKAKMKAKMEARMKGRADKQHRRSSVEMPVCRDLFGLLKVSSHRTLSPSTDDDNGYESPCEG